MSNSHRADRIAWLAVLALAGCMRIYPDPELPDIDVEWFDGDCRPGTGDVSLSLTGVDSEAFRSDVTVPCADVKTTFADVARERYRLAGTLHTADGQVFSMAQQTDIDLRDGLDERASLYFGGFSNFRIAWSFDMAATCASLGAEAVLFDLLNANMGGVGAGSPCELSPYFGNAPSGIYTVAVTAITRDGTTVAVAPEITGVAIELDSLTDLTVVLTPCGSSCPSGLR